MTNKGMMVKLEALPVWSVSLYEYSAVPMDGHSFSITFTSKLQTRCVELLQGSLACIF